MIKEYKMSNWKPTTDIQQLKMLGKAVEELAECSNIIARCIIQGIDESDPKTGQLNRQALQDEIADVHFVLKNIMNKYGLDWKQMWTRCEFKYEKHQTWYNDEIK